MLVSICVPTYNSASSIERCLSSALAQDYPAIEVVVVDDASRDGTPELVERLGDDRIRLIRQPRNRGANRTWNASLAHSTGPLIKFLHHDDELHPRCLSEMVRIFERCDSVGMVFCRRRVVPTAAGLRAKARGIADLHTPLAPLGETNPGHLLLARWWEYNSINGNCIGEPVTVMLRRQAAARVGLFHLYMKQCLDAEMWVRVMSCFDVGFVDAELATYFVTPTSLSTSNERGGSAWVDRLWALETLQRVATEGIDLPGVGEQLERERKVVRRTLASIAVRRTTDLQVRPALRYLRWSLSGGPQRSRPVPSGTLPT